MKDRPEEMTAWIGPAIGVCCYEVGEDVAGQVVEASGPDVAVPGPAGKPHLDLAGAAMASVSASASNAGVAVRICDVQVIGSPSGPVRQQAGTGQ